MVQINYVQVDEVRLGYSDSQYTKIENVYFWTDRMVTPESEGEVDVIDVINYVKPVDMSGRHKYMEIVLALDSNDIEAFYEQMVVSGDSNSRAIREDADNDPIGYFAVFATDVNGTQYEIEYEDDLVWCVDEEEEFSNEEGVERQLTTYMFICIGERSRTEV